MLTQQQIAEHLDLTQGAVSQLMRKLGIKPAATMDELRLAYIRQLRGQASVHQSGDGLDLVVERVLTEQVDRELKELLLAEKRAQLVSPAQVESALQQQVRSFCVELESMADMMKGEIDAAYGINIDVSRLKAHITVAMEQLSRAGEFCNNHPAVRT